MRLVTKALLAGAFSLTIMFALIGAATPSHADTGCTKTLAAGGDLSSFLGTLRSGDTGCLRQGQYTDGCSVSWGLDASPTTRATIRSYPGETATLHTSLGLSGDNLTARNLRIADIAASCGGDMSGFTVQGANDEILYSTVYNVTRHGILTNTSSSNVTVHGNWIDSVGSECNLDHGIYFQTSGRITRNVFKNLRCGYGIHLYSHPTNVVVAGNVVDGSRVRAGILVNCGGNCRVVNNIFVNNATYGITYRRCDAGDCVVKNNMTWGNKSGAVGDTLASKATGTRNVNPLFADSLYHLGATSPALDTADPTAVYWTDRDGVAAASGPADMGAYERPRT
jgi:hypothetical protein